MCGLEERFINLHAQSLAQSKSKVGLRGTKRRSSTNVNDFARVDSKGNVNDSTKSTNSVGHSEPGFKANANDTEILLDNRIDNSEQTPQLEKCIATNKELVKGITESGPIKEMSDINISTEGIRSEPSEDDPYQIEISGTTPASRIKVDA